MRDSCADPTGNGPNLQPVREAIKMKRTEKAHSKAFGPEWVTHEVQVTGSVNHPLCLKVDDLRSMEMREVQNITLICGSGRHDGEIKSYRGVRLTSVLERAEVKLQYHDSPNRLFVTVASSDGRCALFSYRALFNTPVGKQAIVVVERDGQPLDENEGEIALMRSRHFEGARLQPSQSLIQSDTGPCSWN